MKDGFIRLVLFFGFKLSLVTVMCLNLSPLDQNHLGSFFVFITYFLQVS